MIDAILVSFIYVNTAAAYLASAVLIAFIGKHRGHRMNGMMTAFAISSAVIAILYTLIVCRVYTSEELIPLYRISWTAVLVAPASFALSLWNSQK